jgi:hypothetical protein
MEQSPGRRAARPRPTLRSSRWRSGVARSALWAVAALCSTMLPVGAAGGQRRSPSFAPPRWFGSCPTGGGVDCVVDGDTFWIGGEKVRIADTDAPETHPPRCDDEARLGNAATQRGGCVSGASMSAMRTFSPPIQNVSPSTTQSMPPPVGHDPNQRGGVKDGDRRCPPAAPTGSIVEHSAATAHRADLATSGRQRDDRSVGRGRAARRPGDCSMLASVPFPAARRRASCSASE